MIKLEPISWRGWTAAVAGAGLLTLAACGGEAGGETGGEKGGEAGHASAAGEAGEAGEAGAAALAPAGEAGESGAEHGEAGMEEVYSGLEGDARAAMRIQHLKGFFLLAQQLAAAGDGQAAGVLAGQGLLEVYDTAPTQFANFDVATARDAVAKGLDAAPATSVASRMQEAIAAMNAEQARLAQSGPQLSQRMLDVATTLYGHAQTPDGLDPTEYQHALAAALAARDAFARDQPRLQAQNPRAAADAARELDAFVALFPLEPAATPATVRTATAQASRVKLALSAFS